MRQINKINLRGQITHMKTGLVGCSIVGQLCVRTTRSISGKWGCGPDVVEHTDHPVFVTESKNIKTPLETLKVGDWVSIQGFMKWGTFLGIDNQPHTSFQIVATRLSKCEEEPDIII